MRELLPVKSNCGKCFNNVMGLQKFVQNRSFSSSIQTQQNNWGRIRWKYTIRHRIAHTFLSNCCTNRIFMTVYVICTCTTLLSISGFVLDEKFYLNDVLCLQKVKLIIMATLFFPLSNNNSMVYAVIWEKNKVT